MSLYLHLIYLATSMDNSSERENMFSVPWDGLGKLVFILIWFFGLTACQPRSPLTEAAELVKSGQTGEAVEVLREAVADDPDDAELLIQYGIVLVADNRASLALWPLRQASRIAGFEDRAKEALLGAYAASNEFEQVIELATELLEGGADSKTFYEARSMAYYEEKLYEESLADIEFLLETHPKDVHYLRRKLMAWKTENVKARTAAPAKAA